MQNRKLPFLNTNTSKNGRNIHVTDYDETQAFKKVTNE